MLNNNLGGNTPSCSLFWSITEKYVGMKKWTKGSKVEKILSAIDARPV